MPRALLDVNVLIALIDDAHVDHDRVHEWAEHEMTQGWASCAITENGFVRIVTQPRYPSPMGAAEAVRLLRASREGGDHAFWPCDLSLTTAVDPRVILGPGQITDLYLLALAVHHGGTLVTLDSGITAASVPGAGPRHLTHL